MPIVRFHPSNDARKGSASPQLVLENVVIQPAEGGSEGYELRPRSGLQQINLIPGEDICVRAIIPLERIPTASPQFVAITLPRSSLIENQAGGPKVVVGNDEVFYLEGGVITSFYPDAGQPNGYALAPVRNPSENQFLVDDFTFIRGRVVAVERNSGRFWWTRPFQNRPDQLVGESGDPDPGADLFDAVSAATAEAAGDTLKGVEAIGSRLFLFGEDTIEIWTNRQNTGLPFAPEAGGPIEVGLAGKAAKVRGQNRIYFLSSRSAEHPKRKIYMIQGRSFTPISTPWVEELLDGLIADRTRALRMSIFGEREREMVMVDAEGDFTLIYDAENGTWYRFNTEGSPNWDACVAQGVADQEGVFGSRSSGTVMITVENANDGPIGGAGQALPITKRARFAIAHQGTGRMLDSVYVNTSTPTEDVPMTLRLSYDRGQTFTKAYTKNISSSPAAYGRPQWRGLPRIPSQGLVAEIEWAGLEPEAVSSVYINEAAIV